MIGVWGRSRSLAFKLTVLIVVLVIVTTALTGIIAGHFIENSIRTNANEQVQTKIDKIRTGLDVTNQILL